MKEELKLRPHNNSQEWVGKVIRLPNYQQQVSHHITPLSLIYPHLFSLVRPELILQLQIEKISHNVKC